MKDKKAAHKIKVAGLDIAIAVVSFLVVVMFFVFAGMHQDSVSHTWDTSRFLNQIKAGAYNYCVEGYYANKMSGVKADGDMLECYGVTEYYESTYWLRIYRAAGDTVKAEEMEAKQKDAAANMGELSPLKEKIDQMLE